MPVSSYIVRIRRSAGSSTLTPFPKSGCRAVKGPVPSSHSRCYVPILCSKITINACRTKGFPHTTGLASCRAGDEIRDGMVATDALEIPLLTRPVVVPIAPGSTGEGRGRMLAPRIVLWLGGLPSLRQRSSPLRTLWSLPCRAAPS